MNNIGYIIESITYNEILTAAILTFLVFFFVNFILRICLKYIRLRSMFFKNISERKDIFLRIMLGEKEITPGMSIQLFTEKNKMIQGIFIGLNHRGLLCVKQKNKLFLCQLQDISDIRIIED